jgi:streptomycin 6-kinase
MLKVGRAEEESEHEYLALRRWNGNGAVRLLNADPYRRALLLERLHDRNLGSVPIFEACRIVVDLYRRIHIPAMPQLRSLTSYTARWNADLAALPRSAPIPRRLVEQSVSLGRNLNFDNRTDTVIHCDLHYENVLAAEREPWLVIDPKPVNGDPHYELAPMLWNRWDELADDVRGGIRRRFYALVDAAELDEDRARDWVIVRMIHNAMWALEDAEPDHQWLTKCITIAKAVQG